MRHRMLLVTNVFFGTKLFWAMYGNGLLDTIIGHRNAVLRNSVGTNVTVRRFGLKDVKDKILEQLTANTDVRIPVIRNTPKASEGIRRLSVFGSCLAQQVNCHRDIDYDHDWGFKMI